MIIFPALLGLALCLLNAAGANLFCLTSGCTLYAGYSLFGLSFSVYGALGFGAILLLAISAKKISRAPLLLGGVITAGLALDLLFLWWQILYWPCSSCLVMALLLGWTAVGFWRSYPHLSRRLFKGVLLAWLMSLIPVTVATGKEVLLAPWVLYGPADASIRVFFSPTCPACKSEVTKLLRNAEITRMAFYPIAKNEGDVRLLATQLQKGVTQPADLEKLFLADRNIATADPSLRLRWRLAKNKMALAKHGAQTIPYILSPTVLEGPRPPWDNLFSAPAPTPSSEPTGCGAFGQKELPCE